MVSWLVGLLFGQLVSWYTVCSAGSFVSVSAGLIYVIGAPGLFSHTYTIFFENKAAALFYDPKL